MRYYKIKIETKDFNFINNDTILKGARRKKLGLDKNKKITMFKYEHENYECSEACSEKMAYEIAKVLGYKCAKIELAKDTENNIGVLNYLFSDREKSPHTDIVTYLNKESNERSEYYTVSNIKKTLDEIDKSLFQGFIRIMVFDALIGEQDRHEENWGITEKNGKYSISPLYDNGDSLLREFKNKDMLKKFQNGERDFDAYINRSKTLIYKEDKKKRYKHFELIDFLNKNYHEMVKTEIDNLNKLTDNDIDLIVNRIPSELLTNGQKEYIICYLRKRRDILLNKIKGDENNEK
ncbi:MAG: HipA domain-containing protein [Candidatus Gastranaerophilaceae bacterium]|jgi:hipA domain protein